MSRTYRNRKSCPKGCQVRDGSRFEVHETGTGKRVYVKKKFRRSPWGRDKAAERRTWQRRYRAKVKNEMRHSRFESLPKLRGTAGWISW